MSLINSGDNYNPVSTHNPFPVQALGTDPIGHETLYISPSTAVGFVSIPSGAKAAYITNDNSLYRYWMDGGIPTHTEGHEAMGDRPVILNSSGQINNFKAISPYGTTVQATYF